MDILKKTEGFSGVMIIGDIHGNYKEFRNFSNLAEKKNLFIVSLGDMTNRGPDNINSIRLMLSLHKERRGMMIPGNHDDRLYHSIREVDHVDFHNFVDVAGSSEMFLTLLNNGYSLNWLDVWLDFLEIMPIWAKLGKNILAHAYTSTSMIGSEAPLYKDYCRYEAEYFQALWGKNYPNLDVDWPLNIKDDVRIFIGHVPINKTEPEAIVSKFGKKVWFMDTGAGRALKAGEEEGRLSAAIIYKDDYDNLNKDPSFISSEILKWNNDYLRL